MEKEEYKKERIMLSDNSGTVSDHQKTESISEDLFDISQIENDHILQLIEGKPMGILSLLEEQCFLVKVVRILSGSHGYLG